ncbi:hypothetical protein R5R35_006291 [Gryllus longicercus]|uniref:D-beta-hydroxybutyrate dehydrogenase, mitochondrial n=1 Tax=Gryllus longicercus TaxID=2509291 RepID=A0AAN9W4Y8_9ORTH
MRLPYVHEAYRAASVGLQVGVAAVLLLWMLRFVGLCTCACACPCGTFVAACVLGTLVALHVGAWLEPAAGRGVLVTGCDSGFGLALARRLHALGCTVFAGCLSAQSDGAQRLRQLPRVHVLQLDVTKEEQLEAARVYIEEHLPLKGLWSVVNNAGLFASGLAEWTSPEDALRLFSVNTLGTLRTATAFLPLLRRSKGRIVNISSVSGRQVCPLFSVYSMSKYALEALSDGLRFEQRRFGVHVAVVEPGNFAASTRILQTAGLRESFAAGWQRLRPEARAAYGPNFADTALQDLLRAQASPTAHSQDTGPVEAAVAHAVLGKWPSARYHPSDVPFLLRTWINTHAPEWLYEALYT